MKPLSLDSIILQKIDEDIKNGAAPPGMTAEELYNLYLINKVEKEVPLLNDHEKLNTELPKNDN